VRLVVVACIKRHGRKRGCRPRERDRSFEPPEHRKALGCNSHALQEPAFELALAQAQQTRDVGDVDWTRRRRGEKLQGLSDEPVAVKRELDQEVFDDSNPVGGGSRGEYTLVHAVHAVRREDLVQADAPARQLRCRYTEARRALRREADEQRAGPANVGVLARDVLHAGHASDRQEPGLCADATGGLNADNGAGGRQNHAFGVGVLDDHDRADAIAERHARLKRDHGRTERMNGDPRL
jgi:hypothetical protein